MGPATSRNPFVLGTFLLALGGLVAPAAGARPAEAEAPAVAAAVAAGLAIVVNIPAGELTVLEGDDFARVYPVTVGLPRHPTPVGEFTLSKAVWNPWWHPPESWWARNEKPQAPGPSNAMGRAKLSFKPLYFIHGTAETEKLGTPASHGCVRMANADILELARLVHRYASPDLDPATLDALAADPKRTREIPLDLPVTLRIVYERVELRGDQVVVHPDVYRRGGGKDLAREMTAVLAERGEVVDFVHVERVVAGFPPEGGTIPLAELVGAGGAGSAERARR
jgi:murein L,D-transpeptidase YcbB/YkuD